MLWKILRISQSAEVWCAPTIPKPQNCLSLRNGSSTYASNAETGIALPSTLSQRHDIHTWDRLGTAISYSGAGTMRNGQLASISLIKTSEGARRSLRLFRGLTCVGYNAVKQVLYVTYCVIDSHTILCEIARTWPNVLTGWIDFRRCKKAVGLRDEICVPKTSANNCDICH